MKTGVELIAEERARQRDKLWGDAHDDCHEAGVLAQAGMCYIQDSINRIQGFQNAETPPPTWPFEAGWWKPSENPIRNMQKGTAMVAAEMDRFIRAEQTKGGGDE